MRILVINKSLAMMRGGGETRTMVFAEGLAERGHEVTVAFGVPLRGEPRFPVTGRFDTLPIRAPYLRDWSYRAPKGRGLLVRLDESLFVRRAVAAITAQRKPDVVLSFGLYGLSASLKRVMRVPVVVANSGGLPLGRVADAVRAVDAVIADGHDLEALPHAFGVDPVPVCKGVDGERFHGPTAPRDQGPFRLVTVGRLVPVKNTALVLDALARIDLRETPVTLDVVGDGPLLPGLRAQATRLGIAGSVRFRGHLTGDRLVHAYQDAHAFVLGSTFDNFPNAVLEAMSCGLPVVATDVGGVAGQVVDGETGLLVPSGDVEAFASSIERLYWDPPLCERMGRRGRERAESEFTWSQTLDRLEEVLEAAGRPEPALSAAG